MWQSCGLLLEPTKLLSIPGIDIPFITAPGFGHLPTWVCGRCTARCCKVPTSGKDEKNDEKQRAWKNRRRTKVGKINGAPILKSQPDTVGACQSSQTSRTVPLAAVHPALLWKVPSAQAKMDELLKFHNDKLRMASSSPMPSIHCTVHSARDDVQKCRLATRRLASWDQAKDRLAVYD
ncbi:hypothetical protein O181_009616 [Austropuccinia psidii MF-1]|uniref:Uncharacterized protein n=1 Tax=Austropuccinia psidii MF-1 TaxID=1389203 RepID=A0A9Q3GJM7_9BASI|nr:hypothetical protein [Austropuccinia psidii MF-1]